MAAVEACGKERKSCLVGWDLGKVVCSVVEVGKQLNGEEDRELRRVKKTRLSGKACLGFWYPKENDIKKN